LTLFGQNYNFESPEQMQHALESTIRGYQEKLGEIDNEPAPAAASVPEKEFDQAHYVELMGKDPREAANYIAPFTDIGSELEKTKEEAEQQRQTIVAYQFSETHPEFKAVPQGADIIGAIMKQNSWDFTGPNLEAALAVAQAHGHLPTRDQFNQMQVAAMQRAQGQLPVDLPQLPPPQPPQVSSPYPTQQPPLPPAQYIPQPQQVPHQPQQMPPVAPGGYGNPPHMNPNMPNLPPSMPTPGASVGNLPVEWQQRAEDLSPEQIEQIFRQSGQ
jgi:hypothetical protein